MVNDEVHGLDMRAFTKKLNLNVNHQFRMRPTEQVGAFNSYVPSVVPNTILFITCSKKVHINKYWYKFTVVY